MNNIKKIEELKKNNDGNKRKNVKNPKETISKRRDLACASSKFKCKESMQKLFKEDSSKIKKQSSKSKNNNPIQNLRGKKHTSQYLESYSAVNEKNLDRFFLPHITSILKREIFISHSTKYLEECNTSYSDLYILIERFLDSKEVSIMNTYQFSKIQENIKFQEYVLGLENFYMSFFNPRAFPIKISDFQNLSNHFNISYGNYMPNGLLKIHEFDLLKNADDQIVLKLLLQLNDENLFVCDKLCLEIKENDYTKCKKDACIKTILLKNNAGIIILQSLLKNNKLKMEENFLCDIISILDSKFTIFIELFLPEFFNFKKLLTQNIKTYSYVEQKKILLLLEIMLHYAMVSYKNFYIFKYWIISGDSQSYQLYFTLEFFEESILLRSILGLICNECKLNHLIEFLKFLNMRFLDYQLYSNSSTTSDDDILLFIGEILTFQGFYDKNECNKFVKDYLLRLDISSDNKESLDSSGYKNTLFEKLIKQKAERDLMKFLEDLLETIYYKNCETAKEKMDVKSLIIELLNQSIRDVLNQGFY